MFKVGDRIINKVRNDDKLPSGQGIGTVLQTSETRGRITHLFIDWDEWGLTWAPTEVIELDIQTVRDNRLKELGI